MVSFGNITAGGTGKTPAVIERARVELAEGGRVAVLTRGYGAEGGKGPVDSTTLSGPNEFTLLGDEAALMLKKLPELIVLKDPDRVASAQMAVSKHGCTVLLLDDGYQHTALARDENVLLVDAANPFGNGALLPRGILREPLEALSRATAFVLTRCDQATEIESLVDTLHRYAPGVPVRETRHAPSTLWNVADGSELPLSDLAGKDLTAACGIGHPEAFFRTLEDLGAVLRDRLAFPDHAPIPPDALPTDGMVVITEKDAMRRTGYADNVYALGIELQDMARPSVS